MSRRRPSDHITPILADLHWLTVPSIQYKSARWDAVHALFEGYNEIKEALSKLADDHEQMAEIRLEASTHAKDHGQLETAILLALWHYILLRFYEVSKAMQKNDIYCV